MCPETAAITQRPGWDEVRDSTIHTHGVVRRAGAAAVCRGPITTSLPIAALKRTWCAVLGCLRRAGLESGHFAPRATSGQRTPTAHVASWHGVPGDELGRSLSVRYPWSVPGTVGGIPPPSDRRLIGQQLRLQHDPVLPGRQQVESLGILAPPLPLGAQERPRLASRLLGQRFQRAGEVGKARQRSHIPPPRPA